MNDLDIKVGCYYQRASGVGGSGYIVVTKVDNTDGWVYYTDHNNSCQRFPISDWNRRGYYAVKVCQEYIDTVKESLRLCLDNVEHGDYFNAMSDASSAMNFCRLLLLAQELNASKKEVAADGQEYF
jgi:hypothetical protein